MKNKINESYIRIEIGKTDGSVNVVTIKNYFDFHPLTEADFLEAIRHLENEKNKHVYSLFSEFFKLKE